MKFISAITLFLLTVIITLVNSANVLILVHLQGSHVAELSTIGIELIKRGHTVYTVLPQKSKHMTLKEKGINIFTFDSTEEDILMESNSFNDRMSQYAIEDNMQDSASLTLEASKRHCKLMLEDRNLMDNLKMGNFDIALIDAFGFNYCLYIIPHLLSIPTVGSSSSLPLWDMGVPALPSFVSIPFQNVGDKLSFTDKIVAAFWHVLLASEYMPFRLDKELLKKYVPDVSSWNVLFRQSLLFMQFRDEILEWPVPEMPNTLYLPGITYSSAEPLPQSFKNIYLKSNQGVLIVSFGSMAGFIPVDILSKFLAVFAKKKQYEIIWKFPLHKLSSKLHIPSNVHMVEWLPQNDCLGQKKTLLFITHCGNNGQYESLYHGVPMLGFPLFAEQPRNAFRMVDHGFGLSLQINDFDTDDLESAINNIIHNETINKNVRKYSSMLKTRVHPKEEAAHWIEHVIKFGGSHLRSHSMDMPWFQLLMFDVMIFIAFVIAILLVSCVWLCRCICCRKTIKQKMQ